MQTCALQRLNVVLQFGDTSLGPMASLHSRCRGPQPCKVFPRNGERGVADHQPPAQLHQGSL